jgi:hypothetical protein
MRAMNGSALKPKRWCERVTAARHTDSEAASEDETAAAASGGQGLEVKEGAAEEGGTCARRRTSAASLCIARITRKWQHRQVKSGAMESFLAVQGHGDAAAAAAAAEAGEASAER